MLLVWVWLFLQWVLCWITPEGRVLDYRDFPAARRAWGG